jgi:hypothetical protein
MSVVVHVVQSHKPGAECKDLSVSLFLCLHICGVHGVLGSVQD